MLNVPYVHCKYLYMYGSGRPYTCRHSTAQHSAAIKRGAVEGSAGGPDKASDDIRVLPMKEASDDKIIP